MKIIVLHPPMYPVNHEFYNILGKYVELIVYQFGVHPKHHTNWNHKNIRNKDISYKLEILGKGPVTLGLQINPTFLLKMIKENPDIVLSIAFWLPSFYASIIKEFFGYQFLVLTNTIEAAEKNNSYFKKITRKLICKKTDFFISASDLTTHYLKTLCPESKVRLSLQTINMKKWEADLDTLPEKNELRNELSLPNDKTILLGVGNFIELKNWESIISILHKFEQCVFILVGDGKLKETYRKLAYKMGVQDQFIIIQRKEGLELIKYYKASDIFLFPTLKDTFGFVVSEALASGLPVVCSKNAGASSLIKEDYNGVIVDPNMDFTEGINGIVKNLEIMSQNAIMSMQNHTLENRVNEFVDLFNKCLINGNNL